MNLNSLAYFCKVAENNSITKAAEQLFISQPALSKTIISLENELGVQLFDRVGKHIYLNDAGQAFYNKVSKAMSVINHAVEEANDLGMKKNKQINLTFYAASYFIPRLITNFEKDHPDIKFTIRMASNADDLSTYPVDSNILFYSSPYHYDNVNSIPLLVEPFCVAANKNHPLAKKKSISLIDLRDEHFIAMKSGSMRVLLDQYSSDMGFVPNIAYKTNDIYSFRMMIESSNDCIALIPSLTWHSIFSDDIAFIQLKNKKVTRTLYMATPKDAHITIPCKQFMDSCISFFKSFS